MSTFISLHHVTDISFSHPHEVETGSQMGWVRHFTIHDRDGHKTEFTLFADEEESLWANVEKSDG